MVFWTPLIAGGIAGLGLGAGASGGGIDLLSGFEIGTKKEQTTQTFQETYTFSPVITKTYDIQSNIAYGDSTISTKKEQAVTQQPDTAVSPQVIPMAVQGAGAGASNPIGATSSGINLAQILIFAGLGAGAYFLLKEDKRKK